MATDNVVGPQKPVNFHLEIPYGLDHNPPTKDQVNDAVLAGLTAAGFTPSGPIKVWNGL